MTGRERILTAAERRKPDRIPIDFWAVPEVYDRLVGAFGAADVEGVLQAVGCDARYFRGPGFSAPAAGKDDEKFTDHWGVVRTFRTVTGQRGNGRPYQWTYKHLVHSPLAAARSASDIENHSWPDASRWNYSGVKAACEKIRSSGLAVIFGGDRLDRTAQLKAAMYLRGTENFLADLALKPAMAECLLEHVAAYYLDYNRRVFEAAEGNIDIFFMGDDMGTQQSLWVSREMYRRFFKAHFAAFNNLAHNFGIRTMYHSCGKVTELIGDFIDAGLDILQSLQPAAIGPDAVGIKRDFGRQLCFQGGIDIQDVLPHGTPADVDRHIRHVADTFGPDGYIFGTAHNILPDTPTENILALVEAYHRYG
ncbi:MAG: uroporphyrinogen decarboxylase family protein [Planctomycetota bacterium]|nr:uroporphyrinogen decarboxylase family protein [Planctomycetota bacterium]